MKEYPVFSRLVTRRTFTTWDCFGVATFEDCTVHSERSENLHCEYLRFVSSGLFVCLFFSILGSMCKFLSLMFSNLVEKKGTNPTFDAQAFELVSCFGSQA